MQHIKNFIAEHWPLAIVIALNALLFLYMEKFSEFAYGALRLEIVVIVAFVIIHLVFKNTIRPYINEGRLVADFNALPGAQRLWFAIAVIALIIYAALECFTHP